MNTWDWGYTGRILPDMIRGLWITIVVTFLSFGVAIALGLAWAGFRNARVRVVRVATRWTVDFIRGTPLLVQIFAIFYILPTYGVRVTALQAGVFAIGLHYSTYVSETYRGAVLSVDRSQWEASAVLGLSRARLWRSVVGPQAFRAAVPSLANYLIWIYKETALLFVVGVPVLLQVAQAAGNETYRYLEPLTLAGFLYFIVSYPSGLVLRRLERRKWSH
jgi:polar amino acid transport system permease protein